MYNAVQVFHDYNLAFILNFWASGDGTTDTSSEL